MKKIAIITDAGKPHICGVVTLLDNMVGNLKNLGHEVLVIEPNQFVTVNNPFYKDIQVSLNVWKVKKLLSDFNPDMIHIATEGTLGLAARAFCVKKGLSFTTSYYTKFPEYIKSYVGLPTNISYAFFRWFHSRSKLVHTPTKSIKELLEYNNFKNIIVVPGGVDTKLFRDNKEKTFDTLPRPIWLNVGRVSKEKNIDAFLNLNLKGTKVIVGSGPELETKRKEYKNNKNVLFLGKQTGKHLTSIFRSADVFVFPSRENTFGLVILESLSSGTPVAAYPVNGPIDILTNDVGVMNEDLELACKEALKLNRMNCSNFAKKYDWNKVTKTFLINLVNVDD